MDNVSHPSSKDPFTFIISIQCLMIDYISLIIQSISLLFFRDSESVSLLKQCDDLLLVTPGQPTDWSLWSLAAVSNWTESAEAEILSAETF